MALYNKISLLFVGLVLLTQAIEVDDLNPSDWSINSEADYYKFTLQPVLALEQDTFDDEIVKYPFVMVEIYSPACSHCQALLPAYHAAADQLQKDQPSVRLAVYDLRLDTGVSKVMTKTLTDYNVRGTPTLIWFQDGDPVAEFDRDRDTQSIKDFVRDKVRNAKNPGSGEDDVIPIAQVPTFSESEIDQIKQMKAVIGQINHLGSEKVRDANIALNMMVLQNTELSIQDGQWVIDERISTDTKGDGGEKEYPSGGEAAALLISLVLVALVISIFIAYQCKKRQLNPKMTADMSDQLYNNPNQVKSETNEIV